MRRSEKCWEPAMKEIVFVVEEAPESGFTARALGVSILTEAGTLPQLYAAMPDAVRCHFEKRDRPKVIRLYSPRQKVIAV